MSYQQKYIGKFRHRVNVSDEFYHLAEEEEQAAGALAQAGRYRQACYFLIQAMEKFIRAKLFSLVNPNLEYFRDRNRTHSLDDAVNFLVEVVSPDKVVQEQVFSQLNNHVLGTTKYRELHNNLRYPTYFRKYDSYSMLDIQKCDFDVLAHRLSMLKKFLHDMHKLTNTP